MSINKPTARAGQFTDDLHLSVAWLIDKREALKELRKSPKWEELDGGARMLLELTEVAIAETLADLARDCAAIARKLDRLHALVDKPHIDLEAAKRAIR